MLRNRLLKLFTAVHVFLYRQTGGRIGNFNWEQGGLLLLTTRGRKTGKQRTTPVGYLREKGYYLIIGSNNGLGYHPSWYLNLRQNPQVEIQIKGKRMQARAEEVTGAEQERLWARLETDAPRYANYRTQTTRKIPLVALYPEA
jgi:deazaflavin-dependent oxidoreductase (nitroreductase family)